MKKLSIVLAAAAAMVLVSCGGNKPQEPAQDEQAQQEALEAQQLKAQIKARLDSCAALLSQKPMNLVVTKDGVKLNNKQKAVKPTYLLVPDSVMPKLETLSLKYRALCMFDVDKDVAKLYGLKDVYTPVEEKLAAEINDPAINYLRDSAGTVSFATLIDNVYKMENEAGRDNFFWAASTATLIEQLYVMGQNQDAILASFTDQEVSDLTFHISILVDNYDDLCAYDPELANLYQVVGPLEKINAVTVDEFRAQLNEVKAEIEQARQQCLM